MEATRPSGEEGVDLLPEEQGAFLSGAPRSGQLSPFAQKLAAESFVWLCSVVVFGNTIDFSAKAQYSVTCTSMCHFAIATGFISLLISSVILLGQYLAWTNKVDKSGWFSSGAEMKGMIFLSVWWAIGVAFLSALEPSRVNDRRPVPHASNVSIFFGWLAFFGSIFGAYKAYHAEKEEQRSVHYAHIMSIQATEDEEFANFS